MKITKSKVLPVVVVLALIAGTPLYAANGGMAGMGNMNSMAPAKPIVVGNTEQNWQDHTFKLMVEGGKWTVGQNLKVTLMITRRYKKKVRPVKNADVSADLNMPEMGHNLEGGIPFSENKPGHYSASIRVAMPGTYNLLFNFQKGNRMHAVNFNFAAKN